MSDLLERLAAANPVGESDGPSIEEVWRKIEMLDARAARDQRSRRRRLPRRGGRVVLTSVAVALPVVVVVVVAASLLGARSRPVAPAIPGRASVTSTLDPAAQRVAAAQLGDRIGAVVALDPRTGAIRVMYGNAAHGTADPAAAAGAAPSTVAATVQGYSPAGVFEIVTAAAGLDTGQYTPDSLIAGGSPLSVAGTPIHNDFDQSFGHITLSQALSESVNTVFAQVGSAVGRRRMTTSMRRLGFYSSFRLTAAGEPVSASGVRIGGRLVLPSSRLVDLGRLAIGQGGLVVTPLQMAMVAAAVAHGGSLMVPHLHSARSAVLDRAMKPSTARALTQMMRAVVTRGTGTPAGPGRVPIAGKTGTSRAAASGSRHTDVWFIGLAPVAHPTIAIAVALQDVKGGFGGTTAAPIAARVIAALLADHR